MTPAEFLTTLWGDPLPGQVLTWMMPSKLSTWWVSIPQGVIGEERIQRFLSAHMDQDVYTGVALAAPNSKLGPHARVSSAAAYGIAGLWADIDIADEVHKKTNLPPTPEVALAVLDDLGYEPSITIHSGHGLQCWWLFEQPWIFKDAHERHLAQQLTQAWHHQVSKVFLANGWTLDATHDLARVLRLPGTFNHKSKPLKPVQVIATSDFRWRHLPNLPQPPAATEMMPQEKVTYTVGQLTLHPDLNPPQDKLECMLEAHPKFKLSWLGQRTDFKDGDQSASAYDQSLASLAVMAGWNDQEIVNLLVAHRRHTGQDLKLRLDYYQRTIGRARSNAER